MNYKVMSLSLALVLIAQVSFANPICNGDLQDQNPASAVSARRSQIHDTVDAQFSKIVEIQKAGLLSPKELESMIARSTQDMLNKGHLSWMKGYRKGLDDQKLSIETPRFKPVPKGPELDALVVKIEGMTGVERESFLALNGLNVIDLAAKKIEQNINQYASILIPSLNRKLNGIHEKYSQLVGSFVMDLVVTGKKLRKSDITKLSAEIHKLWMIDSSWKVQSILAKFGVSENAFWGLNTEEIIYRCESIIRQGRTSGLSSAEVDALMQFTDYELLSIQDKYLDDQILMDHVTNLYNEITEVVNKRTSAKNVTYRVNQAIARGEVQPEFFVKDAPILAYRITSGRYEDIPAVIRQYLGSVDNTPYPAGYLEANIGSALALQIKETNTGEIAPDFYVIGKSTFLGDDSKGIKAKYEPTPLSEVQTKNKKVYNKVIAFIPGIENDPNLVGGLKKAPVKMYSMKALGFKPGDWIQSPWSSQQWDPRYDNAYLTWDEGAQMFYELNLDDSGRPISYIRYNP